MAWQKVTWIRDFHHSSLATIVPNSLIQPTPVSPINLFHNRQSFLQTSHLFFSWSFCNGLPVCSQNDFTIYFYPFRSKCELGRIPISIALMHISQNICKVSLLHLAFATDSESSMICREALQRTTNKHYKPALHTMNERLLSCKKFK